MNMERIEFVERLQRNNIGSSSERMRILAPVQELVPAHVLTGNPPRAQAVSSNPPNIDVDSSQRTGNERVHYIRYTREELRRIAESYEG